MALHYHYIYFLRGGPSNVGLYCGVFCVRLSRSPSDTHWSLGTALSFKPIYYALRGGASNRGSICGTFCANFNTANTSRTWDIGAALSLDNKK